MTPPHEHQAKSCANANQLTPQKKKNKKIKKKGKKSYWRLTDKSHVCLAGIRRKLKGGFLFYPTQNNQIFMYEKNGTIFVASAQFELFFSYAVRLTTPSLLQVCLCVSVCVFSLSAVKICMRDEVKICTASSPRERD